jgi:phosphoribosylglycinamide formyltransferase-1
VNASLAVLASGRGSNFASIAESCETGEIDADVDLVISNNQDAGVLGRAERRGIDHYHIPHDNDDRRSFEESAVKRINQKDCDLVILAGFMRVLTPYFVNEFKDRILNIHPSLLPAFKGLQAQKQALEYGVKVTGCTVHVVTEDVDDGPIVDQVAVRVKEDDTVDSLSKRILEQEHKLFPRAIQRYIDQNVSLDSPRSVS